MHDGHVTCAQTFAMHMNLEFQATRRCTYPIVQHNSGMERLAKTCQDIYIMVPHVCGSLYDVHMLLLHTHNVGFFLYYVYVDEAMSEDLLAHICCNYCMYFIVQMSEINPSHFRSTPVGASFFVSPQPFNIC